MIVSKCDGTRVGTQKTETPVLPGQRFFVSVSIFSTATTCREGSMREYETTKLYIWPSEKKQKQKQATPSKLQKGAVSSGFSK